VARGAHNVIVTLGERGALIVTRLSKTYIPSFKVKPVDTTAAGDAFIGGMAVALLHRKALKDAVKYGCACGALATTRFGAQPSLPTADEVKQLLRSS
jgi:ribokinase